MKLENQEKITSIIPDLTKICFHLTKGHELTNDLIQEILLELLEKTDDQIDEIEDVRKYASRMAYLMWLSEGIMKDKYINTRSFHYKFRYFEKLSQADIEDMIWLAAPEDEKRPEEVYDEILSSNYITNEDKAILKEYVRRDCKVSQLAVDAGVNRHRLSKRIKKIIEKCKVAV